MSVEQLQEYDFRLVLDASGSMTTEDCPNGRSRWQYMQESVEAFARDVAKFDSDGIDVIVFGGANVETFGGVTPAKVSDVFASRSPRGSTPLAEALTAALNVNKTDKKVFILVFTDGVPDDKQAAANVILRQANKQASDDECTFLFVQIGKDESAARYLKMLDDDLRGAKFDIVDAKTQAEAEAFATTAELVLHAISD